MADDKSERVWDILKQHSNGMLTTRFAGGLRARPLDARPDSEAGAIFFLTDVRGLKDDEIEADPAVCFVVVDEGEKAYLSITGRAQMLQDAAIAARIWKATDDMWWPQREHDTNVRVIQLEPERAELWDGPKSSAVAAFEFAKARLTGTKPKLGENRKSTIDMKA
ncbi:MAG: pyridoxamine 5'-phosphate oxidase family protein [Pseudolabrys sp.]|nr:pyridoxamine 5'-phosphate oxidase family protein [Pseudolabrys sp.]